MPARIQLHGLSVAKTLHRFIETEALPGAGVTAISFGQDSPA
jgi:hypothetical protein